MRHGPLDPGSTQDWVEAERMKAQIKATFAQAEALRDLLVEKVRAGRANHYEIAELLAQARRTNAHEALLCPSFGAFAVKFGGVSSQTSAREHANTWERLQEKGLEPLRDVARTGLADWSKVKEAARPGVATPATAADWATWVVAESHDQVRARAQIARNEEPTKRFTSDLRLATHARYTRWVGAQSEKLGHRLTFDEALDLLLATAERAAKGGSSGDAELPSLPAPSARLVHYTNLEHTKAEVEGPLGAIELTREELEELECDALHQHPCGKVTHSIPPRIRRQVVARDRGRCAVHGCGALGYLHVHHSGEGGRSKTGHDLELMLLLCAGHHRLVHRGWLRIEGTYTTGFRFLDVRGVELAQTARWSVQAASTLAPAPASASEPRLRGTDMDEAVARQLVERGATVEEARALVVQARSESPPWRNVEEEDLLVTALMIRDYRQGPRITRAAPT